MRSIVFALLALAGCQADITGPRGVSCPDHWPLANCGPEMQGLILVDGGPATYQTCAYNNETVTEIFDTNGMIAGCFADITTVDGSLTCPASGMIADSLACSN